MDIPSDLKSTIALLEKHGQLVRIKKDVDPRFELTAICWKLGLGTPNTPPAQNGPAVLFEKVKGYFMPLVEGVYGSRERVALLLGCPKDKVPFQLIEALKKQIPPILVKNAPCQEVVIDENINLMKTLPIPIMTEADGNLMINAGITRAGNVSSGTGDVTYHRICVQGPDKMTIAVGATKHIGKLYAESEASGKPLPISINIGYSPAIGISTSFRPPTTPMGLDELNIAGGLLGSPVEIVKCKTVDAEAIAGAEIVIEGEILLNEMLPENFLSKSEYLMADFAGYHDSIARPPMHVIKVKAITHRKNPVFQTLITPGEEQNNLSGVPTEASILQLAQRAAPNNVINAYCAPSGGGKLIAIVQVAKKSSSEDGLPRQIALQTLASMHEIKHAILVDNDIDIFDPADVLWAMTTRFQANLSLIPIPGILGHHADPSWYFQPVPQSSRQCKAIFDCTVPYELRKYFRRPKYLNVDVGKYLNKT